MRRLRIGPILAAILLGLQTSAPLVAEEVRLRTMTWNVRFDFEDDGPNRWVHRKEAVARLIEASEASIVAIQEDKSEQVADLEPLLTEYAFVGRGRNADGSGEHCSILYKKRHLSLVDSGAFWLSETPREPGSHMKGDNYPRVVTWAALKTSRGKKILALNTHLPEGDEDGLRTRALEIVRDWLAIHLDIDRPGEAIDIPVVVAGDFNTDAGTDPYDVLTQGDRITLADAWAEAKPRGWGGTYNGFKGLRTKKRIDWILVGGPVRVVAAGKFEEQVDGRWPSDHYPVYADLEMR